MLSRYLTSSRRQSQAVGINCGGAGLGWSGGAALGARLALEAQGRPKFVCAIVGDGAFLFSVPGSVYWIAARYGIPVLTVVLNKRGEVTIFFPS